MGCFDTGKLSDNEFRNGSVTHVWVGALLVQVLFCRANMMTVADAKRFVASRRARRSGIAAPLCHIWLPAAPLRQLASSYDHACKSSPALHLMHAWWIPDRVLGKSALFMIFRLEAVPESTVRRYFLQVPALLNLRFPGSHMPVCNTDGVIKTGTVWDRLFRMRKKNFFRQVLKLGANEASAQGLQNAL